MRLSRATWGDVLNATGWRYGYGEEDWYTSATAIQRTRDGLTYANTHGSPLAAIGFGWCWDMTSANSPGGVADPVYQVRWAGASRGGPQGDLRWGAGCRRRGADRQQREYGHLPCGDRGVHRPLPDERLPDARLLHHGPVDGSGNTGETGYQRHLKHEKIRAHIRSSEDRVLFDYADILSWSDARRAENHNLARSGRQAANLSRHSRR